MNGLIRMTLAVFAVATGSVAYTNAANAAPVINAVYTTYSSTGVPTSITISGTGLCTTSTCTTKPTIKLGGITLAGVTGTRNTGVSANLGLISDGDYLLTLTAGTTVTTSTTTTFLLAVRAKTTTGSATTVTVGTTTTGVAGTNASVSNTGTATAPVLNFTVPRGATGAPGANGAQGLTGASGLAGPTGPQGPQGVQGVQGATGPKGDPGTNTPRAVIVDSVGNTLGPHMINARRLKEGAFVSVGTLMAYVQLSRRGFWGELALVHYETADCTGQPYLNPAQNQGMIPDSSTAEIFVELPNSGGIGFSETSGPGTKGYVVKANSLIKTVVANSRLQTNSGTCVIGREEFQAILPEGTIDLSQYLAPFSTVLQ